MRGVNISFAQGLKLLSVVSVIIGVAVGFIGLVWYGSLLDFGSTTCWITNEQTEVRISWTLIVLGPYIGCALVPVAMIRRTEQSDVRLLAGFMLGVGVAVLTGIVISGSSSLAALIIPVLVGVAVRLWWRRKPGRFAGYVLGLASTLAVFLLIFIWTDTCS